MFHYLVPWKGSRCWLTRLGWVFDAKACVHSSAVVELFFLVSKVCLQREMSVYQDRWILIAVDLIEKSMICDDHGLLFQLPRWQSSGTTRSFANFSPWKDQPHRFQRRKLTLVTVNWYRRPFQRFKTTKCCQGGQYWKSLEFCVLQHQISVIFLRC